MAIKDRCATRASLELAVTQPTVTAATLSSATARAVCRCLLSLSTFRGHSPRFVSGLLGWSGSTCNSAVCATGCKNGGCTSPDTVCLFSLARSHVLWSRCCGVSPWTHLTCPRSSLLQCVCQQGWSGTLCDQPVCNPTCEHGSCTSPNTVRMYGLCWPLEACPH
jgi:hypothetical protein